MDTVMSHITAFAFLVFVLKGLGSSEVPELNIYLCLFRIGFMDDTFTYCNQFESYREEHSTIMVLPLQLYSYVGIYFYVKCSRKNMCTNVTTRLNFYLNYGY